MLLEDTTYYVIFEVGGGGGVQIYLIINIISIIMQFLTIFCQSSSSLTKPEAAVLSIDPHVNQFYLVLVKYYFIISKYYSLIAK